MPVEQKVKSATVGSALAGAIVWALSEYVFRGDVPPEIGLLVAVGLPALLSFAGGFAARHTWRTDAEALKVKPYVPPPDGS
ncbi:hypothetical protein AB0395_21785 [Streptosporangium sp. NPDC051023]|uniref:hypothetical protein n=1 Tax=Streptosporangium sp. NPDC051023 TaxID=3155410 RepID=UPI00344B44EE